MYAIAVVRPDGTGLRQLTSHAYDARRPRWSPDAGRVSFSGVRREKAEVWSVDIDGSGLEQITDTPAGCGAYAWSPERSRIACTGADGTSYIIDPRRGWDERNPQGLPKLSGEGETLMVVSWSPDGRWLAGEVNAPSGQPVGSAVYAVESQEYRRLTQFGYEPRWLSDSRRLLFQHDGEIFLLDIESGAHREVLSTAPDALDYYFAISADDRWIYFTRVVREADIWMLTLDEESP